jgi:hypothetical protein
MCCMPWTFGELNLGEFHYELVTFSKKWCCWVSCFDVDIMYLNETYWCSKPGRSVLNVKVGIFLRGFIPNSHLGTMELLDEESHIFYPFSISMSYQPNPPMSVEPKTICLDMVIEFLRPPKNSVYFFSMTFF